MLCGKINSLTFGWFLRSLILSRGYEMVSFFEILTLSLLLDQVLLICGWIGRVFQTFISPVVLLAVSAWYSHITFDFVSFTWSAIVRSSESLLFRLQLKGFDRRVTALGVLFCRTACGLRIFLLRGVVGRRFSGRGRRRRVVLVRLRVFLECLAEEVGLLLRSRRLQQDVLRKRRFRVGFGC